MLRDDDTLLSQIMALDEDVDFNYHDGDWNSALYISIAGNRLKTAQYLLSMRNADPNLTVTEGLTAIHLATNNRCL